MDEHTLFTIFVAGGAACILAAIVGGGISLNVVSIPALSRARQLLLAVFGTALVAVGFWKLNALKEEELAQQDASDTEQQQASSSTEESKQ